MADLAMGDRDGSEQTLAALTLRSDGTREPGNRKVAIESPVAISFLGIGYAVMMATPANLEDFAVGFAFSERLIDNASDVTAIDIERVENGILLGIELAGERHDRLLKRVRHRVGETSCGLCGIENLEQALRPLPVAPRPGRIETPAIFAALEELRAHQPLNDWTGAVHAAAWCDAGGAILAVREDVGRHNALDKLVGHGLRDGRDFGAGFVLLTSRCSYELVEKAALAGIALLVTVSAPTALAVDRAAEAGLTLIALARADAMLVMSDPHGLFGSEL